MIKAPFNFVPLSEKVFFPPWAEQVSHDIPFSDGESGEIDITITAKSPIFIRDGKKVDNNQSEEFCHFIDENSAKKFYIPGSSLKGMTRNVLEIMSFSKIEVDEKKLNKKSGVRDMTPMLYCRDNSSMNLRNCPNNEDKEKRLNHPLVAYAKKCAILNLQTGKLTCYGDAVKIRYDEIEEAFSNSNYNYREKSIYKKYTQIDPLSEITIYNDDISGIVSFDTGYLFMNEHFGQGNSEKKHEFVIYKNNLTKEISNTILQNFKDVYFQDTYKDKLDEKEKFNVGEFWQWKYESNKNTEIPVFCIEENNTIIALSLTQVSKIPYNNTLLQAIKQDKSNKPDLSQTIFGYTKKIGEKNIALKGRVHFGHFLSTIERYETINVEQVLGEPKPTYFPNYILQNDLLGDRVKTYKTLMDNGVQIRGWKRYPLREEIKHYDLPIRDDGTINHEVSTKFKPLPENTEFKGKIRFHNLKKVEIGAILSALTFHGNQDNFYHNIGMAKPLGYGKIQIQINTFKTKDENEKLTQKNIEDYIKTFELYITTFNNNWLQTQQLKELFAMAKNSINNDNNLQYQRLNPNDFVNAKRDNKYLKNYTDIISSDININSLIQDTDYISLDNLILNFINNITNIEIDLNSIKKYMNNEFNDINNDILDEIEALYDNSKFSKIQNEIEEYFNLNIDDDAKANIKVKLLDYILHNKVT